MRDIKKSHFECLYTQKSIHLNPSFGYFYFAGENLSFIGALNKARQILRDFK